jgi:hypothetical protein
VFVVTENEHGAGVGPVGDPLDEPLDDPLLEVEEPLDELLPDPLDEPLVLQLEELTLALVAALKFVLSVE